MGEKMINIKINGDIENKVIREIRYFVSNLNYKFYIGFSANNLIIKTNQWRQKTLVYILAGDLNLIDTKIEIKTFGAAVLGNQIAKIFEEFGYKKIELNVISDTPYREPEPY